MYTKNIINIRTKIMNNKSFNLPLFVNKNKILDIIVY